MLKKKERSNKRIKNSLSRNEKVDIKINDMTRKQFEAVLYRTDWKQQIVCDYIVIMPSKKMHDSGYRYMDFVMVKDGKPLCRSSECSDVIHIDGMGGYGYTNRKEILNYSDLVERKAWSIDCLKKSGLLRMWVNNYSLVCGPSLSSFEIWAVKDEGWET